MVIKWRVFGIGVEFVVSQSRREQQYGNSLSFCYLCIDFQESRCHRWYQCPSVIALNHGVHESIAVWNDVLTIIGYILIQRRLEYLAAFLELIVASTVRNLSGGWLLGQLMRR